MVPPLLTIMKKYLYYICTSLLFSAMVISLSACSGSDDDESGGSGLAGWYMNGLYTTEDVNGAMSSLDLNNTTFFNSSGELCITENTPQTGNVHYATMSYMVTWLRFIEITNSNTLTIYSSGKIFSNYSAPYSA